MCGLGRSAVRERVVDARDHVVADGHAGVCERRGAGGVLFIAPTETPDQWARMRRLPPLRRSFFFAQAKIDNRLSRIHGYFAARSVISFISITASSTRLISVSMSSLSWLKR